MPTREIMLAWRSSTLRIVLGTSSALCQRAANSGGHSHRRLTAAVVRGFTVLGGIRHAATHSARAPVPPRRQGHGTARRVEGAAPRLARSQRRHDGRHPALRNTPNCACMCVQLWADWGEKAALCARACICMLRVATHCSTYAETARAGHEPRAHVQGEPGRRRRGPSLCAHCGTVLSVPPSYYSLTALLWRFGRRSARSCLPLERA